MIRWIGLVLLALPLATWAFAQEEKSAMPEIGKPAPDFRLNDQEGRAVSLGEHGKERWKVLAFFPKASTPG